MHEIGFAKEMSYRILFMDESKVLEDASLSMFFDNNKETRTAKILSKIMQVFVAAFEI